MAGKVKREEFATYLNITPESPHILGSLTATYALIGEGVTAAEISMGPKVTDEQYIADDAATSILEAYAPSMAVEQTAILNDEAFDFVDQLRLDQAIFGDAESDLVHVWLYETAVSPGVYPAEQQKVAIAVEDIGDAAGAPIKINWTPNYIGDPIVGTFTVATKTFTAT
jgi:hypothetical protein